MKTTKITVNTTVDANREKVWNYWNRPEHITQWNFAADDWHCPKAENDLKVGGTFKYRMEAKDGSFGFDFEAIYDEIVDQEKIAYTMTDGRKAVTTFNDEEGKTKISTTFDPEEQNPIEMQRDGWQAIINNFKKHVELNP
ncbi:MAG: SRPBCC family protein [Allomuricauda sp.]